MAVTITSDDSAISTVDIAFSFTPTAEGGTPSFLWSIAAGALPDGLSLAVDTGEIAGTPLEGDIGEHEFTLSVVDSVGGKDTQPFSLLVVHAGPFRLIDSTVHRPSTSGSIHRPTTSGAII